MLGALVLTTPLLATAPVAAGSAGPTAEAQWSPVTRLAPNALSQALTVDGRGTVTAVWTTSSWPQRVVAARRPAGGSWSAPRVLGRGYAPVAGADKRGRVTVVWLSRRPDFTDGVLAARRPVGGPWSDPVRLTRDRSVPGYPVDGEEPYGAAQVDLAVSARGAAVVTWTWGSDERAIPWRIQAATRPATGSWTAPRDVTAPGPLRHPDVDIAGDATATLVYGRQPLGEPQAVLVRRRVPGVGWTKPVRIAAEGYAHQVAVDRAGDAVVAYSPDFSRVRARYRPASGAWQPARALSPAGASISDFALAMNAPGRTVVAMGRSGGRVDLTTRTPGTSWSAPELVSGPGEPLAEVLAALDDRGDLYVGWGNYALFGRYRPAGDTWSDRFTVSPDSGVEVLESADAVVAPDGDVAVLWDQESLPLKVRVLSVP
jgi:hypothetical protein